MVNNGPKLVNVIFEGHKILPNLHRRFDRYYIRQIYSGDFAKFCGLLRIYELYYPIPHRHIQLILIIFDLGGSTGQLNQQPQPRINLPRHVDVVSSDDTQPSWSGLHHTQVNSNGQASSSGVYSGPPGSNNVGSLGRSVMRRLHDSGFSPDASRGDHRWTGKIFSGFKKNSVYFKSWSNINFFWGQIL